MSDFSVASNYGEDNAEFEFCVTSSVLRMADVVIYFLLRLLLLLSEDPAVTYARVYTYLIKHL